MQLGFVSAILPDQSLEDVLGFAAETGYDCVEVMCWPPGRAERRYAGVTHLDVTDLGAGAEKQFHDLVFRSGVAVSALGYYPNPLDPDPVVSKRAVAHLEKVIIAADALGLRRVTTFIGRDPSKSVEDNWPRMLKTWTALARLAEDRGVRIGIENCPMLFTADEWPGGKNLGHSPAIWRRLFAELGPAVGLNYDPSHMVWQQMDYLKPIREIPDRLYHVHAKDVRLDRHKLDDVGILAHPNLYHTPKLPGMGDVDWGQFFSALTDAGYLGPVCVEVEDRAYEGSLERRKASLRQSLTFLRNYVPKQ
jgi:sugar phosphate isomerase/epimerase